MDDSGAPCMHKAGQIIWIVALSSERKYPFLNCSQSAGRASVIFARIIHTAKLYRQSHSECLDAAELTARGSCPLVYIRAASHDLTKM
jgi:hypothetical protein